MAAMEKSWPAEKPRDESGLLERALLQHQVEQFLYDEAALLDARKYREWLDVLVPDIHYWMPIRRTVTRNDIELEFTKHGDMAFFDDDRDLLDMRVKKLEASSAWAEDPPSRSRHFVSNVRIVGVEGDEITLDLCFHLYRTRLNTEVDSWVGRRTDVLRRVDSGFKLARRHIFLDQTVIRSTNMSTLF
ncbi:MAG TPA: 3-phenylpropionate/cinnamic acid dioxygenase subunit beta [Rhizomicrobium sp.]|jgi:biphenyl 2,3-dioxygenase beta subunit